MANYSVKARKTGAEYPLYAAELGPGWQFILEYPEEPPRAFSCHKIAHAFAARLMARVST